ncbi:hypothetical protein Tco_0953390 [Tanacetum coccineum]|uniref:Uncharacterized protein n=1 Tax=Tanacetum coccineum TaxID=301880 RepID=A0ABQ5DZR2_9ASTR
MFSAIPIKLQFQSTFTKNPSKSRNEAGHNNSKRVFYEGRPFYASSILLNPGCGSEDVTETCHLLYPKGSEGQISNNNKVNQEGDRFILKKLPVKLEILVRFTIPCDFSKLKCQGVADLGAVKLNALSVFHSYRKFNTPAILLVVDYVPVDTNSFDSPETFSGSTTNSLHPSSSPVKTSDNIEKFTDELAPLDSLPSGNDDSTLKKEFHEVNFQVYSNPLFEFDEKASELEDYLEKDSIPPGIDLTLPTTLEVLSSNPTSPTLTGEKKSRKNEKEVSSDVPINIIVMPIQITFDNPIDFNDHFSKPKDLKKDLPISFDSTTTSILPHPSLDSDSPFTAELVWSVILEFSRNTRNKYSNQVSSLSCQFM